MLPVADPTKQARAQLVEHSAAGIEVWAVLTANGVCVSHAAAAAHGNCEQGLLIGLSSRMHSRSLRTRERECCLLVLNLVSSTLPCIRQPRPRLRVLDVCGFV